MKHRLLPLLLGLALLGCSPTQESTTTFSSVTSSRTYETVSVTVSLMANGSVIEGSKKVIQVEEGAVLLDVMKEHYKVEETRGFIVSIAGHAQNAKTSEYWLFEVNGEPSTTGAGGVRLHEGDDVVWRLSSGL